MSAPILEKIKSQAPDNIKILLSLENKTILNIQSAADLFFTGTDQEIFERATDFPASVPPWQKTWVEWFYPSEINSCEKGHVFVDKMMAHRGIGSFTITMRIKDGFKIPPIIENITAYPENHLEVLEKAFSIFTKEADGIEIGWILNNYIFMIDYPSTLMANTIIYLDKKGTIIEPKLEGTDKIFLPSILNAPFKNQETITDQDKKDFYNFVRNLEDVTLFAFNFCNCKKSQIVENKISRQVRRNLELKNKPVIKNYTLEISAMKRILLENSKLHRCGIKKSFHLCRGHFKNYDENNKLFGKYTGNFWWDMQVRGNEEIGKIIKDYKIKDIK